MIINCSRDAGGNSFKVQL